MRFENGTDPVDVAEDDFRYSGQSLFIALTATCLYSVETVNLGLTLFLQNDLITSATLSRK